MVSTRNILALTIAALQLFASSAFVGVESASEYPSEFPTDAPSMYPSEAPTTTLSPTPSLEDSYQVEFTANFTLTELSSNELESTDEEAITVTVAISSGLGSSNADLVSFLGYIDVTSRRKLIVSESGSYSLQTNTKVSVSTQLFPSMNATALYSYLSQNIDDAVTSGSFGTTLMAQSMALGASVTSDVGPITVSISPATITSLSTATSSPTPSPADDDEIGKDSIIAAAVIAGVVGSLVIGLGVYLAFFHKPGTAPASAAGSGGNQSPAKYKKASGNTINIEMSEVEQAEHADHGHGDKAEGATTAVETTHAAEEEKV